MSHRTDELEPLTGLPRLVRELRYHEVARQGLAVVLILVYALTANATQLWVLIGLPVAMAGMLIRFYASGFIVKNKELATTGPYALVRHPLYTGNILLVFGFAVANASWWALPLTVFFFWFYYPTAVEYEDRKLHRIFGDAWEAWATDTPALMPNFKHTRKVFAGSWSFANSTRKNGEIFIVVFVLICAYLIVRMLP